jgi:hypothetical protein
MFSADNKKKKDPVCPNSDPKESASKEDENQGKRFVCHRCSKNFRDEDQLKRHMKPREPTDGYRVVSFDEIIAAAMLPLDLSCSQCPAHFDDRDLLNLHEALHKDDVKAVKRVINLFNTLPSQYSVSLDQNSE